jgi:DNA polymerase-3 subunit delta
VTPDAAIKQARAGELLPVYLLSGDDQFLRDQVVAELRAASLGSGIAAFNEDRFTAGEADADKVIAAARTVPMMAARRFVLVRGADRWDSGSDEGGAPLDKIAAYAGAPVPSTCMVLTATKLDGRRKLTALAKKQDFLVACEPLDTRGLIAWILARAKLKGHAMDREVAELLAEIAGPELSYVNDAMERLSLYVGDGKAIDEHAVSECVARVRTADTWALVAAVGTRDLGAALRMLADAYDPRDRGLPLLGALAWSIRQLARYHAGIAAGNSPDEAAKRAGVYQPHRARELAARAKGLTRKQVERWLLVLAETDVALKSSRRPADAILEEMLTRLCRR